MSADDITLHVQIGCAGPCNWEMSPALLTALANLGVTLAISCYRMDEG